MKFLLVVLMHLVLAGGKSIPSARLASIPVGVAARGADDHLRLLDVGGLVFHVIGLLSYLSLGVSNLRVFGLFNCQKLINLVCLSKNPI